jgi:hypothetical protein
LSSKLAPNTRLPLYLQCCRSCALGPNRIPVMSVTLTVSLLLSYD